VVRNCHDCSLGSAQDHRPVPAIPNPPRVIAKPASATPKVPQGFEVELFVSNLHDPRTVRVAPNGDIFIAESEPGRIRVLTTFSDADQNHLISRLSSTRSRGAGGGGRHTPKQGSATIRRSCNNLSFPKIPSLRIRAVRQNQRIIRCDVCDHPPACNLHSRSVQATTPA
jgi:glucose/arabinose dehydrogenase